MPNTVLVPVDGSNFAEHALPYALGIARRTGATLHLALVHVPADVVAPTYPLTEELQAHHQEQRDREVAYMEGLAARLEPAGVEIRPALLRGRVPTTLTNYVEEQRIELVVMTTHGRGGLQRAWLGSTADSLVRHCMVPILLARPSAETREIGPESGPRIRRMLVALDGSETAERALQDGLSLGITDQADVVLAHVLQPTVAAAPPYLPHTIQLSQDELAARTESMRGYLARLASEERLADRTTEVRVEVDYQAAPAILDLAEEVEADLIVLGTHGRGGLRRLILGSVADKVIRGTHRPVLVHRGVGRFTRLAAFRSRNNRSEHTGAPANP